MTYYDMTHADDVIRETELCPTLQARMGMGGNQIPLVLGENTPDRTAGSELRPRRLTPLECERLQGMPDDWTRVPYLGRSENSCPDTPRYKAIGNSWAVPCIKWLGKRIDKELKK